MHAALLWIKQDEMLQDLDNFLNRKQPQADLHHRGARG
jgi:hypothetical protein